MDSDAEQELFLDTGATIPLVTRKLASTLKANRIPESAVFIQGLVGRCYSPYQVQLKLNSLYGNESLSIKAHVVDAIPATPSHVSMKDFISKPFLKDLQLADPDYQPNCKLDILLGIKQCNPCSLHGISMSADKNWKDEETIFEWAVGGAAEVEDSCTATCLQVEAIPDDASKLMQNLWSGEELPGEEADYSPDELQAIHQFEQHYFRSEDGR